jgi:serine/threonine protein kinase
VTAREEWRRLHAVQELFAALAPLSEAARDRYLDSRAELPVETIAKVRSLLGVDTVTALPAMDPLVPDADARLPAEPCAGDLLGPYRLVRRLGSGGMGIVFEAVREEDEISLRVAVKVLHPELRTSELLQQLRQEAAKLARLRHPNIARLLDWKLDSTETPYCVLEYVDGEAITDWCRCRTLPRRKRIRLLIEVCDAVTFAHRNLIAHLDLKPANILVNEVGEIRLMDFGIAQTLAEGPGGERPLRAYSARYASPELMRGEAVSAQSDIYSLGVVLRELLTEPAAEAEEQKLCKPLPYELEAIAACASAAEAEQRYATVEEFEKDLHNYLDGFPVQAVAHTPLYLARRFCRRNGKRLAAGCVVVVALAAGVNSWLMQNHAKQEHLRAERLSRDVHQLSTTLLFPLEDEMRNLPGATPARLLAVHTGLEFLQNLATEAGRDSKLNVEIAEAYTKLGDIQGNPANSNLGDEQGALASFETARRLLANLRDGEGRYAYGVLLTHEGDLITVEGNNQEAMQMYREAAGTLLDVSRASPGDLRVKEALEAALNDMGDLESAAGQDHQARAHYDQAQTLSLELLRQQPKSKTYQRYLARCLSHHGDLDWTVGDFQQAGNAYRASFAIDERLLRQYPDDLKVRYSWIAEANNVAEADEQLGRQVEALALYLRVAEMESRTTEIDPHNSMALRDQQVGYSNITRVLLKLNKLPEAESSVHRELTIAQVLWNRNRQDAMAADDLSGSEEHLAEVKAKRHQYAAAIASEKEALLLLRGNLQSTQTAESLGGVVDGLLHLADYDLNFDAAHPGKQGTRAEAEKTLAELRGLEPRMRPGYAEDKQRAQRIRKLAERLKGIGR